MSTPVRAPAARGPWYLLQGELPAARVHQLQQQLPALTRGDGVLESAFDHDHNTLDRQQCLLHVMRRA
jgi:ribosomal protection tetracycline resistance protein